jgi:hypothetical protein
MVAAFPLAGEERVALQGVSWKFYESMLQELGEARIARMAYDRGVLEIMSPLMPHERGKCSIDRLIAALAEALDLPLISAGSLIACLGDGHEGVWNVFEAVATASERLEILDWYHLKENLYKIGGSLKRIQQAEAWLWQGCIDEAKALFQDCQLDPARKFCHYLERHRHRIVNYAYFQAEGSPIGSGAVESSIKQIDHRMKLTGAQWKSQNVPRALSVRCAYLKAQLSF